VRLLCDGTWLADAAHLFPILPMTATGSAPSPNDCWSRDAEVVAAGLRDRPARSPGR